MDKNEQIFFLLEKLKKNKPAKCFKKVSDMDSGMRFLLDFLLDNNDEIYATTISEKMNISRARCGILLKKMEVKGLITKINSKSDARICVISLTEKGKIRAIEIRNELYKSIEKVIDNIGYEKFNNFIDTATKIKTILEE